MEVRQAFHITKEFVALATSATRREKRAEELYHYANAFMRGFLAPDGSSTRSSTGKNSSSTYQGTHTTPEHAVFTIVDTMRDDAMKDVLTHSHQMTFQEQEGLPDWVEVTEETKKTGEKNKYTVRVMGRRFVFLGKRERLDNTAGGLILARRILDRVIS